MQRIPAPLLILLLTLLAVAGCRTEGSTQLWLAETLEPLRRGLAVSDAVEAAEDPHSPDRRREGLASLAAADPRDAATDELRQLYRAALDDPDATVRAAALAALARHGQTRDAARAAELLTDDAAIVRWEAAHALQRLHDPQIAGRIVSAMGQEADSDVRLALARALGQYPHPSVFHALVGLLHDHDYGVAHAAHAALATLTGAEPGRDARDWLAWARQHRGNRMFENRQPYTYQPYHRPPGLIARLQIWRDHSPPQPRTPRGLDEVDES